MLNSETVENLRHFVRATFPYLVFIGVFIIGMLVIMLWASSDDVAPAIQPRAHSHNDYTRERPLLDALDLGFCSVEADIHLVDGALLVAHDRDEVDPARTLDAMYLKPLWARFEAHQGAIYPEATPFTLLIDIKSDGADTFSVLERQLAVYAPMFTRFTVDNTETGAVTVIISGNRANDVILAPESRLAGIDGRLDDLAGPVNPHQMPLVSDNWFKHFKWLGVGEMPPEQEQKLEATVAKAREAGVRLRFWATPQSPALWGKLYDAGVDLLNADDLSALHAVLMEKLGD